MGLRGGRSFGAGDIIVRAVHYFHQFSEFRFIACSFFHYFIIFHYFLFTGVLVCVSMTCFSCFRSCFMVIRVVETGCVFQNRHFEVRFRDFRGFHHFHVLGGSDSIGRFTLDL